MQRTVLITGCSDGGLGAALALAFHSHGGYRVIATARNPSKMSDLSSKGIQCLPLDVLEEDSIALCVKKVSELTSSSLDLLVNNAGGASSMPLADLDITDGRKAFDLNVWSVVAVTQKFLPLLINAKGIVVNNTSVASVVSLPFQAVYNSSKAAAATLTDNMRLEFKPFGIRVVELKTGAVHSNFFAPAQNVRLPPGSLYEPIAKQANDFLTGESIKGQEDQHVWAKNVVHDLSKSSPPARIWRGGSAGKVKAVVAFAPHTALDGMFSKFVGLDVLARKMKN